MSPQIRHLLCRVFGHTWVTDTDTDESGWYLDDGWTAWGISRECQWCGHLEHREEREERDRFSAALERDEREHE